MALYLIVCYFSCGQQWAVVSVFDFLFPEIQYEYHYYSFENFDFSFLDLFFLLIFFLLFFVFLLI